MESKKIKHLYYKLKQENFKSPVFTSAIYRLAKGTDASFYRLVPEMVVQVNDEEELQLIVKLCSQTFIPLTIRAGGTSLSGQTITDSVLVELGPGFSKHHITNNGQSASFQPGVRGGYANALLSKYGRKIGPSPASINSAKIGGIVANNASGASYGIATNSYNTVSGMRIVFADGSILNTSSHESRKEFKITHKPLISKIQAIREYILGNIEVAKKIRSKYKLKNTCGYGMNSFLDYEDPIDIISHLMIGSEGTLGLLSEVTFDTVEDNPLKACSLLFFPDIRTATKAILPLRECKVSAAELMDRNALRSVENNAGMPELIKHLAKNAAALLIETSAGEENDLINQILEIRNKLKHIPTLFPISFTRDKKEFAAIWKVRKGLFTSAAAARPKGTACIIEDVAFSGELLGDAISALQELLINHTYENTVIWGHLLDGNVHFLISPDFGQARQLENYKHFMHQLSVLVVEDFNGSLKAEHGTGRNMAAFVEFEWGKEIYGLMKQIKQAFDPENILNPGVLINDDSEIYAKNIKPFQQVNQIIDDCIECGFCESHCPSKEITLTPRQRIVVYREMTRLLKTGSGKKLKELSSDYNYHGIESCATDGLCAVDCPVGINTGTLMKELRFEQKGKFSSFIATFVASHFGAVVSFVRIILRFVNFAQSIFPTGIIKNIAKALHKVSGRAIPLWNEFMPKQAPKINLKTTANYSQPSVVYFPACINRMFGTSKDYDDVAVVKKTEQLLQKAGYNIIYPENLNSLCCGMAFDSKGFKIQGLSKLKELEKALLVASRDGKFPVLCEMSPCLYRMKSLMDKRIQLFEPVEFTLTFLTKELIFNKLPIAVAIHSTCSNTKMGLDEQLYKLAEMCAEKVSKPNKTECCGWAGDKGFNLPELNKSALKYLPEELETNIKAGYSTSRTCEIGLTLHGGISYKSIFYLVDIATMRR